MKHHLRVITMNLCNENPMKKGTLINKWITVFTKMKGDILFLQEINSYNLEKLVGELGMKLLNINNLENTCVLINPYKLNIIDNNHVKLKTGIKPIYIGGIHLDDIPSLPHHLNNVVYKSSETVPLSYSLEKLLKMCTKRRLPRIKEELSKIKKNDRAIIAGDFNEPSHLDLDKIKVPVSKEFEKQGFIDTYRYKNGDEPGFTWPAGAFYKKEPVQRVDIIYTKGMKIVASETYDTGDKWLSDHRMVITDLIL
jgi:endonuclease/exonuclease/phosphatase family metal-dependent hydrolase